MPSPHQRNSLVLLLPPVDVGGRGLPLRGSALALLRLHYHLLSRRPSRGEGGAGGGTGAGGGGMCSPAVDLTPSDLVLHTQKPEFSAQMALSLHPGLIWTSPLGPEILLLDPWNAQNMSVL